ncbi:uncharacterized protein LOC141717923 isoform X2 [Apium graveolens]|uniref:uncharacterized protein LOC141717923 isoform X2 n=1 Tax=Apium graveolens TaxID=4045 RepID=UPI003D7A0DDF
MGSEEEISVEQAAAERRERLRALKAARQLSETDHKSVQAQGDDEPEDAQDSNISMKFRNYLPHDKQLQEGKLAPPVLPKFEDPVATEPPTQDNKEDPFLNIAPKKPNWDLRRDVQKKLDKLEKRTQKAIFQLMEEEQEKQKKLAEEEACGLQE